MTTIGVTGHQKLPAEVIDFVRPRLDALLARRGEISGITSLAEGADQLFADAVLSQGGALVVVLPSQGYEATFDTAIRARFRSLKSCARQVVTLDHERPTEAAFLDAGRWIVDNSDMIIAIWDGKPSRGLGGTADVVEYARHLRVPVVVLWPDGSRRK